MRSRKAVAPRRRQRCRRARSWRGFWVRTGAYLIDAVVLWIANFAISFVVGLIAVGLAASGSRGGAAEMAVGLLGYGSLFVVTIAYFIYFWTSTGQTLGHTALGLRAVRANGARLDGGTAFLRYIGYVISGLLFALGLMWVGWDDQKQGWHDKIAGTYVIRVPSPTAMTP